MHEFKDDKQFQARLLANHPAVKAGGVDPLWRWVALIGWVTVAVLVAVAARGEGKLEISNCQLSISNLEAKNFCAVPVPAEPQSPRSLDSFMGDGEAREGTALYVKPYSKAPSPVVGRTLAAAQFISPRGADTLGNLSRVTLTSAGIRGENHFTITEGWLDALECVESGMDAGAVGDQGRSRGSFQFKAVAWEQVNTLRKSQGLVRHSYRFGAHNRVTARIYAREYLRWLESYLIRALGRSPTSHELYAVWNLGPAGFRARGFDLRRCPEHVRKAAGRLSDGELRVESRAGGGK